MLLLKPELPCTKEEVKNNVLSRYFPIRTKDRQDIFNWDSVLGHVVKQSYGRDFIPFKDPNDPLNKKNKLFELSDFKEKSQESFLRKLDVAKFWFIIDSMYFQGDGLYKIAPEFLLFKTNRTVGNTTNSRLGNMFSSLLQDFVFKEKPIIKLNFLEQQLYDVLNAYLCEQKNESRWSEKETPYLPFMTSMFQNDLNFLSQRPKYLLTVFKDFLRLYAHLYTAQLALNLKDWRSGEPKPKYHYFILDNEKASDERILVKDHGYKQLKGALWNIFPYLAMNESLQSTKAQMNPIWVLAKNCSENPGCTEALKVYAEAFKENRQLNTVLTDSNDPLDQLDNLFKLALAQFSRGESRHEINSLYVKSVSSELCESFIQSRGRAGRVMVFNQDYLILLTNLAIGERDKLRFHELILAFEARGVFFDKQSQKALIEFFERIGNVERMSDSGDAVYVIKTI
ncbi:DNA phosphorothioation-dependent restriction protein DptG [uncultured Shewanella sp.]|uniref:DNA phosphorothioation-dependent restriction protein DptG n=1 Tax=uncultured Shewanella sp. TaxID=173975 RepID=UPI0026030F58|nr:DNA phosphorothioation-dependent restriction protein DptG [uncultured Shewanella sp.]